MLKLVKYALLAVIAVLMIGAVVIGIGSETTGPLEKAALVVIGGLLFFAAAKVHTIGATETGHNS